MKRILRRVFVLVAVFGLMGASLSVAAQLSLEADGDPLIVELQVPTYLPLFNNNSSVSIAPDGDIAVVFSRLYVDREEQVLIVVSPENEPFIEVLSELVNVYALDGPSVTALPGDQYAVAYHIFVDDQYDIEGMMLAEEDSPFVDGPGSSGKLAGLKASNTYQLSDRQRGRLDELNCIPAKVVVGDEVVVGDIGIAVVYQQKVAVHCQDSRTVVFLYEYLSAGPGGLREVSVIGPEQATPAQGAGGKSLDSKGGVTPPAQALPQTSITTVTGGQTIMAYAGQGQGGGSGAVPTVITLDQDLVVTEVEQFSNSSVTTAPGSPISSCGHPELGHYWVAWTDANQKVRLARIEGNNRNIQTVGDGLGPMDIACDAWGNAMVSWWGIFNGGTAIHTSAVSPDGTISDPDRVLLGGAVSFAEVSNSMDASGRAVVAWSTGGFGVLFQRYQISGGMVTDGTLSGSWYSSLFDGEGFIIDIAEVGGVPTMVVYYFTYTDNGNGKQAWIVGSAPIENNSATVPVAIGSGARFGDNFDPNDVVLTAFGTIQVSFLACGLAEVRILSDVYSDLGYIVTNLTPPPTETVGQCASDTSNNKDAKLLARVKSTDGSQGVSWYDPARSGEGFIFDIVEIGGEVRVVLYFFTYANNNSGRQFWLVGSAPIVDDVAEVPVAFGEGTRYGLRFDPDDISFTLWGTIRVVFVSCTEVTIEYDGLFGIGTFTLANLTMPPIGSMGMCN